MAQYTCGNGGVRCNPAYFSSAQRPQGICVGGDGRSIPNYTLACIEAMPQIVQRFMGSEDMQKNHMDTLGFEIARYCRLNPSRLECVRATPEGLEELNQSVGDICFRGERRSQSWLSGLVSSMAQVGAAIGLIGGGAALLASRNSNASSKTAEQEAEATRREQEVAGSGSPLALTSFRDERTLGQRAANVFRSSSTPASVGNYTPLPRAEIQYRLTEEEESDLVSSGRIETGEDNYRMLAQTAREAFARGGESACRAALRDAYERIQPEPIWSGLSLEERSKEIFRHANHTYEKLVEQGSNGRSVNDPNEFHSDLSPAVAVCIAFIETRGTLNPHALNYTFCQSNNTSTAHGLGQMTRRTFRNMRGQGGRPNLLPLTVASEYDNLETDQIFGLINNDVTLQMEVLLRYANYEIKRLGDLMRGVQQYDQDHASNYMRRFRNCHACVNQLTDESGVYQCYQNM